MTFRPYVKGVEAVSTRTGYDQVAEVMKAGDVILLLEGGADINPAIYGQENRHVHWTSPARDEHETKLYNMAREYNVPILGICRGHQLMAALDGGTLFQDLRAEVGAPHSYEHPIKFTTAVDRTGFLALMMSNPTGSPYVVNSMHHQGVDAMPAHGTVLAYAPDRVPEAIWYPWGLGVQWHPECLGHSQFLEYMRITFIEGKDYGDFPEHNSRHGN